MFHQNFLKLRDRITSHFDKQNKLINQDIHIRDILVYCICETGSYGEAKFNKNVYRQDYPVLTRLVDHIGLLANLANDYHKKYYCEKDENNTYILKKDCLNKITRLSLSEFSLYTHDKPLTIEEFNFLVREVHKIASEQQPNVHLLLSSMPVLTECGTVLNMSLYVQCGSDAKIIPFCKGRASSIDLTYAAVDQEGRRRTLPNFYQQRPPYNASTTNISNYITSEDGRRMISNNTVFTVKTAGDGNAVICVDVCLDHRLKHSKELLTQAIKIDVLKDSQLIPNQVDHLVTSNTIDVYKNAKIADRIVQVEWQRPLPPTKNDPVTTHDLNPYKRDKYFQLQMCNDEWGIRINNPPFGANFVLSLQDERKLSKFSGGLKRLIDNRNKRLREYTIESNFKQMPVAVEFYKIIEINDTLNSLIASLLSECEATFLEKLFNAQNFQLKMQARKAIMKLRHDLIQLNCLPPNEFKDEVITVLQNLRNNLLHHAYNFPNSIFDILVQTINPAITNLSKSRATSVKENATLFKSSNVASKNRADLSKTVNLLDSYFVDLKNPWRSYLSYLQENIQSDQPFEFPCNLDEENILVNIKNLMKAGNRDIISDVSNFIRTFFAAAKTLFQDHPISDIKKQKIIKLGQIAQAICQDRLIEHDIDLILNNKIDPDDSELALNIINKLLRSDGYLNDKVNGYANQFYLADTELITTKFKQGKYTFNGKILGCEGENTHTVICEDIKTLLRINDEQVNQILKAILRGPEGYIESLLRCALASDSSYILNFSTTGCASNLYRGKDGKIYLQFSIREIDIQDLKTGEKVGVIPGRIKIRFKLCENKGEYKFEKCYESYPSTKILLDLFNGHQLKDEVLKKHKLAGVRRANCNNDRLSEKQNTLITERSSSADVITWDQFKKAAKNYMDYKNKCRLRWFRSSKESLEVAKMMRYWSYTNERGEIVDKIGADVQRYEIAKEYIIKYPKKAFSIALMNAIPNLKKEFESKEKEAVLNNSINNWLIGNG